MIRLRKCKATGWKGPHLGTIEGVSIPTLKVPEMTVTSRAADARVEQCDIHPAYSIELAEARLIVFLRIWGCCRELLYLFCRIFHNICRTIPVSVWLSFDDRPSPRTKSRTRSSDRVFTVVRYSLISKASSRVAVRRSRSELLARAREAIFPPGFATLANSYKHNATACPRFIDGFFAAVGICITQWQ